MGNTGRAKLSEKREAKLAKKHSRFIDRFIQYDWEITRKEVKCLVFGMLSHLLLEKI